jgi:hypothetical protein
MEKLRNTLGRLGWPIGELSDETIIGELHRRWFGRPVSTFEGVPMGMASAMGIVSALAKEGNLDALCWSPGMMISTPASNNKISKELPAFERPEDEGAEPGMERRRSPRKRAKDFVTWTCWGDTDTQATGWLVCRAAEGIAFITETDNVPPHETTIEVRVHSRHGGILELGKAAVVRTEMLNDLLTLVCVELEKPVWSQGSEMSPARLPDSE